MKQSIALLALFFFSNLTFSKMITTYHLDFSVMASDCKSAEELVKAKIPEVRKMLVEKKGMRIVTIDRSFCMDEDYYASITEGQVGMLMGPKRSRAITLNKLELTLSDMKSEQVLISGKIGIRYIHALEKDRVGFESL